MDERENAYMPAALAPADDFSLALIAERPRLLGLCRRLTGSGDAAEDLAQETLLEAWRLRAALRELEGLRPWLDAIARNVCHRWGRAHGRERAHRAQEPQAADALESTLAPLAEADLSAQVERAEVAEFLEQALAALPDQTRALTRASVVAEMSAADLARAFGLTEVAVRVRLYRGRQALRRIIYGELRAEAAALDLTLPAEPIWTESRIWCPFCGSSHLRYRIDRETGEYAFICMGACAGNAVAGNAVNRELVEQVSSPKSLLARHCLALATSYRAALAGETAICACGAAITIAPMVTTGAPTLYGINGVCPNCGLVDSATAWHLALDTIEAQRFWRRYPCMRALPMELIERNNRPAIVTGFAAADGSARLRIVSDATTYALLHTDMRGAH